MQQFLTRKNIIWMVVLASTAWLTWQTYQQEHDMSAINPVRAVLKVKNSGDTIKATDSDAKLNADNFELMSRVKETKPYFNLFAVPEKKIDRAVPNIETVSAPVAPALPFKYLGAVTEMNQTKVILEYQGEVLAVVAGDSLGVNYKLVSINKVASNSEFLFLFLPMNIMQTMVVSNVSEQ